MSVPCFSSKRVNETEPGYPNYRVLKFKLPCIGPAIGAICDCKNPCPRSLVLPGDPTVTYTLPILIRGIVEVYFYGVNAGANHFLVGELSGPSIVGNIYSIRTSNPKQVYRINASRGPSHGEGDGVIVALNNPAEQTVNIPVKGGSCLTLTADVQDGKESRNQTLRVVNSAPLITDPPQPYASQFMQLDIDVSVFYPSP